jgi:hypothetical protein
MPVSHDAAERVAREATGFERDHPDWHLHRLKPGGVVRQDLPNRGLRVIGVETR